MDIQRKLVSIKRATAVEPIEGYDRIELCRIGGWQVVIAKNSEIKPGDLVVYFEVDSILPKWKMFEFMEKHKYRLRSIRLGGKLSQGLALPLRELALMENPNARYHHEQELLQVVWEKEGKKYESLIPVTEGYNLTAIMCVEKYEREVRGNIGGDPLGNFPYWVIKTDEERIQNLDSFASDYNGIEFVMSEKVEGTSCTMTCAPDEDENKIGSFHVAGRSIDFKETPNQAFWMCARESRVEEAIREHFKNTGVNLAIQGEVIGPGIQGNYYKLKRPEIRIFNGFNVNTQSYIKWEDLQVFCDSYKIPMVPTLGKMTILNNMKHEDILQLADGPSLLNPNVIREGIVFRAIIPADIVPTPNLCEFGKISFKAVSNQFLLGDKSR